MMVIGEWEKWWAWYPKRINNEWYWRIFLERRYKRGYGYDFEYEYRKIDVIGACDEEMRACETLLAESKLSDYQIYA